jgi:hypothetical protein
MMVSRCEQPPSEFLFARLKPYLVRKILRELSIKEFTEQQPTRSFKNDVRMNVRFALRIGGGAASCLQRPNRPPVPTLKM